MVESSLLSMMFWGEKAVKIDANSAWAQKRMKLEQEEKKPVADRQCATFLA